MSEAVVYIIKGLTNVALLAIVAYILSGTVMFVSCFNSFIYKKINKEKEMKNIKVDWKKGKPEKDEFYIVTIRGDLWGKPNEVDTAICLYENGHWVDGDDNVDDLVLGWLELPEPMEV